MEEKMHGRGDSSQHHKAPDEKQVLGAWLAVTECIRRESEDEPPRWLAIGWLPDGRSVEFVALELIRGWLIIHALSSVQKKFWQEIERARQRGR